MPSEADFAPPGTLAGWPRRVIALIIDWFVALATVSLIAGQPIFGDESTQAVSTWWALLAFLVEVALLTALLGSSFGQMLTSVRIARLDGRPLDPWRCVVRTALICLVIPPLINTNGQRGLQDLAVGSVALRR